MFTGNPPMVWWCDLYETCSPGKLEIIRTYFDVVCYAKAFLAGRKQSLKVLIRQLAQAKGLPGRAGPDQARAFFRPQPSSAG
jgi:hypothetical protein